MTPDERDQWADEYEADQYRKRRGRRPLSSCGHVLAATYGTKGCQLPICAGDREAALQREWR